MQMTLVINPTVVCYCFFPHANRYLLSFRASPVLACINLYCMVKGGKCAKELPVVAVYRWRGWDQTVDLLVSSL